MRVPPICVFRKTTIEEVLFFCRKKAIIEAFFFRLDELQLKPMKMKRNEEEITYELSFHLVHSEVAVDKSRNEQKYQRERQRNGFDIFIFKQFPTENIFIEKSIFT